VPIAQAFGAAPIAAPATIAQAFGDAPTAPAGSMGGAAGFSAGIVPPPVARAEDALSPSAPPMASVVAYDIAESPEKPDEPPQAYQVVVPPDALRTAEGLLQFPVNTPAGIKTATAPSNSAVGQQIVVYM
jgi:hypothetical protein